ncbi:MAG: urea ABC transporter ATP-binding subunit UrtE [Pseudomonadota bacterium]
MLNVHGVNQFYGDSHTLRDLELEVPEGRILSLLGRNGVGKTTLLNAILGLLPLRSGTVRLGETLLDPIGTEQRVRCGIGYVPQGRMIFPDLSVRENLRIAEAGRAAPGPLSAMVSEFFPVLDEMAERRGGDLSGGQQQQLAIGRALILEPRVLLLDEPCEGIQPNIVQLIGATLSRLRDEFGLSILLVEQKLPFARSVADDFAIMDRGRIVARGSMTELDDALVEQHLSV